MSPVEARFRTSSLTIAPFFQSHRFGRGLVTQMLKGCGEPLVSKPARTVCFKG